MDHLVNDPAGGGVVRRGEDAAASPLVLFNIEEGAGEELCEHRRAGQDGGAETPGSQRKAGLDVQYGLRECYLSVGDGDGAVFAAIGDSEAGVMSALPVHPCEGILCRNESSPAQLFEGEAPGRDGHGEALGVSQAVEHAVAHAEICIGAGLKAVPADGSGVVLVDEALKGRAVGGPGSCDAQIGDIGGDFGWAGVDLGAGDRGAGGEVPILTGEQAAELEANSPPAEFRAIDDGDFAVVGHAIHIPLDQQKRARLHVRLGPFPAATWRPILCRMR